MAAVTSDFSLLNLSLPEMSQLLGGSRSRAVQVLKWLYAHPGETKLPASIPGVSQKIWEGFKNTIRLPPLELTERSVSWDGTRKYIFSVDRAQVETVLIPGRGRSTVCVSSQAGCTRRCAFCATATLGFRRNLKAAEILAQYRFARSEAADLAPARNVVFMGMGEPMDNLEEVLRAVTLLTQAPAPQLGAEQVTVSTSGILPGMKRFLAESKASLALSLNATTDAQREALMPQNHVWPIRDLLGALEDDAAKNAGRVHFIEYVMFDALNDSLEDATRLVGLLKGLPVRVNLIPHNPFPGNALRAPSRERVLAFQSHVHSLGRLCFVRWPRGRDIGGACGQLALASRSATGKSA